MNRRVVLLLVVLTLVSALPLSGACNFECKRYPDHEYCWEWIAGTPPIAWATCQEVRQCDAFGDCIYVCQGQQCYDT